MNFIFMISSRHVSEGAPMMVLQTADWRERSRAHFERAVVHTGPARQRKDRGLPHPVEDFLFQYYPFPLSQLECWQPGIGIALEWPDDEELPAEFRFNPRCHSRSGNRIVTDASLITEKELARLEWIRHLLASTASRAGVFSCHGLHEWAMVYGGKEVRHEKTTPLRLPQAEIDALVASRPIACTHHDAFRFFAADARPLNRFQPSLDSRVHLEQPGCVHANMDLYKWSAKAMPWIGTDVLLDCFELACELRELDMRASPYDLTAWGREPIRIETQEGRRVYETEQRRLATKAAPLRGRLIEAIGLVLTEARSQRAQAAPLPA